MKTFRNICYGVAAGLVVLLVGTPAITLAYAANPTEYSRVLLLLAIVGLIVGVFAHMLGERPTKVPATTPSQERTSSVVWKPPEHKRAVRPATLETPRDAAEPPVHHGFPWLGTCGAVFVLLMLILLASVEIPANLPHEPVMPAQYPATLQGLLEQEFAIAKRLYHLKQPMPVLSISDRPSNAYAETFCGDPPSPFAPEPSLNPFKKPPASKPAKIIFTAAGMASDHVSDTMIHELSHVVICEIGLGIKEDHGPAFQAVYKRLTAAMESGE